MTWKMLVVDIMTAQEIKDLKMELYGIGMGVAPDVIESQTSVLGDDAALGYELTGAELGEVTGNVADLHLKGDSRAAWQLMDWEEKAMFLRSTFPEDEVYA